MDIQRSMGRSSQVTMCDFAKNNHLAKGGQELNI